MKNDTPRTDAVLNTFDGKASKLAADLATHAEELERELTAATKDRDEARGQRDRLAEALQEIAEGSSCCACRGSSELASIAEEALQSLTPNEQ